MQNERKDLLSFMNREDMQAGKERIQLKVI
jgi:hypothetical protein